MRDSRNLLAACVLLVACGASPPPIAGAIAFTPGVAVAEAPTPTATASAIEHARAHCFTIEPLTRAAQRAGGANWKPVPLVGVVPRTPKSDPVEALERAFRDADFRACLDLSLGAELDLDGFLERRDLGGAARVAVTAAACAFQEKLPSRANEILRDALTRRYLDLSAAIEQVANPNFARFAQDIEREVAARPTAPLEVVVKPSGATISVDGREARCERDVCRVEVIEGSHLVVAERFGYLRSAVRVRGRDRTTITLAESELDASAQLAAALHGSFAPPNHAGCAATGGVGRHAGAAPTEHELGARAAEALAAPVVALVDERADGARALVYDRRIGRVVAIREERGAGAAPRATQRAILDWREQTRTPWYKSWKLWVGVAVLGAATSASAVYLAREVDDAAVFR